MLIISYIFIQKHDGYFEYAGGRETKPALWYMKTSVRHFSRQKKEWAEKTEKNQ